MLTSKDENFVAPMTTGSRWAHALRLDWLGQMVASLLWVSSVFVYGISSLGDVLQLCAALAWTIANLDALMRASDGE